LEGKIANIADENKAGALLEASNFKDLSSGGLVTVKKLYAQPYTIRNRAKFIFNSNKLPTTSDLTKGLMQRAVIIPFNAEFLEGDPKTDPYIEDKIFNELPGVFNFAVEGYKRLKQKSKFTMPEAVKEMLEIFEEGNSDGQNNWYYGYYEVTRDPKDSVEGRQVYFDYEQYCQTEKIRYPERKAQLLVRFSDWVVRNGGARKRLGKSKATTYFGVKRIAHDRF
jgi:putative DNA primase/helicase